MRVAPGRHKKVASRPTPPPIGASRLTALNEGNSPKRELWTLRAPPPLRATQQTTTCTTTITRGSGLVRAFAPDGLRRMLPSFPHFSSACSHYTREVYLYFDRYRKLVCQYAHVALLRRWKPSTCALTTARQKRRNIQLLPAPKTTQMQCNLLEIAASKHSSQCWRIN